MPGTPPDFFEAYHTEGDNQLRLLHCESESEAHRSTLISLVVDPSGPRELFDSGEKGRINAHTVGQSRYD